MRSYSVDNVVISNRYISKLVTQVGEKEAIYDLYKDILTYDSIESAKADSFSSKELYIKKAGRFFAEGGYPESSRAIELVRAIYAASKPENKAILLGYIDDDGNMNIFSGDWGTRTISLRADTKLLLFMAH